MVKPSRHTHLQLKFGVSGAAETGHCSKDALEKAKLIGKSIAEAGIVLVNGATTGFPYWAAIGAKEAGGFTIGISPALSEDEHVNFYKLPIDYMDMIIYTASGYSGRDVLLTHSVDAVIIGCGRIGTLHEFTVAFEQRKPIGVLTGTGGTTDMLPDIIRTSSRGADNPNIIFEADPAILVGKLKETIERLKSHAV